MRKLASLLALALCVAFVGCNKEEAKVEDTHTVKTPEGTTKVTETKKVETDKSDHAVRGKHAADCACPKDANGVCQCEKDGKACHCTKDKPQP